MAGLESIRGGNRGTDGFDGGGGRNTLIRSTAGFPGELPGVWVVSFIASGPGPVSGCCGARFFLRLGSLELEGVGCGDISQLLKSEEGICLFALAGLELPFVCFASMSAAAAWMSPLHCTRVSRTTSCPGFGTVSRLATIAISVSVSASLIARCLGDGGRRAEEKQPNESGGSATGKFMFASTSLTSFILSRMRKSEPIVASRLATPSGKCRATGILIAKLVCD